MNCLKIRDFFSYFPIFGFCFTYLWDHPFSILLRRLYKMFAILKNLSRKLHLLFFFRRLPRFTRTQNEFSLEISKTKIHCLEQNCWPNEFLAKIFEVFFCDLLVALISQVSQRWIHLRSCKFVSNYNKGENVVKKIARLQL